MEDGDQDLDLENIHNCTEQTAPSIQQTAFIGQSTGTREISMSTATQHGFFSFQAGRFAETSAQASPDRLLGRQRPRPHRLWTERYVKLLVVGDSGLVHPL